MEIEGSDPKGDRKHFLSNSPGIQSVSDSADENAPSIISPQSINATKCRLWSVTSSSSLSDLRASGECFASYEVRFFASTRKTVVAFLHQLENFVILYPLGRYFREIACASKTSFA